MLIFLCKVYLVIVPIQPLLGLLYSLSFLMKVDYFKKKKRESLASYAMAKDGSDVGLIWCLCRIVDKLTILSYPMQLCIHGGKKHSG